MITAAQLRAARVLLGIDQRELAELSGLSVPTIQRMEASESQLVAATLGGYNPTTLYRWDGDRLTTLPAPQSGFFSDLRDIATWGGAFLEMLEGKTLPAFEILEKRTAAASAAGQTRGHSHTGPPFHPEVCGADEPEN